MVYLVAEATREQSRALVFVLVSLSVQRTHLYLRGARAYPVFALDRETSLKPRLRAGGIYYLGIYQFYDLARLHLYHHDTAEYADLRSGKPDSVGISHGFEHIVEERACAFRYFVEGTALLAQCFLSFFEYIE